ncbi:MAG TPA: flavin reductase family protein [Isosphaeraceae bacterium]|jgi:flavin reductase (DIM6/NTAB) family NADH-FMN oxidoreductase RutF|nr:flavin reductase family protein [Isosphaeraceae bacterium]
MLIEFNGSNFLEIYQMIIGVVTPRPIAWVSSVDGEGRVNLAPFSFFNVFGTNPPVVIFSPTLRRDGSRKDTLRNVEETGEFVLNAAVADLAEQVNLSSKELPRGESEVELTGLTLAPSLRVRPPRVAESPAHLECKLRQVLPIGDGPTSANLVIGEVLLVDVADRVLGPDGRVDPTKLKTIARLGGDWYCRTSDLFTLERPR